MKKSMNKILSLALALAMMLSMSITAFAADTATINFLWTEDGESIEVHAPLSVTIKTGETIYSALQAYNQVELEKEADGDEDATPLYLDWTPVPEIDDKGEPTGVICQALNGMLGRETEPTTADNHPDIAVQFWSNTMQGYGLVSTSTNDDGQTVYHYVYAGYAWMYSVTRDGVTTQPTVYMDQYELEAGDVVTLNYCVEPTYWESTEYLFVDGQ